jgi:hypothetical protein
MSEVAGQRDMQHRDENKLYLSRAHLLELLDGTLVNTTALVDQVWEICESLCPASDGDVGVLTTGSGGLAGVDVADDHDVDVKLLLTAALVRLCSCGVSMMLRP